MKMKRSICRILLAGLIVTASLSCWNPLYFKDGDGNLVAEGTATADVNSSGPVSASVTLEFLDDSGVGTITLNLSFPAAGGVNTVEGTLIDSGNISEAVTPTTTRAGMPAKPTRSSFTARAQPRAAG